MTVFKIGDRVKFVRLVNPEITTPVELGATGEVVQLPRWAPPYDVRVKLDNPVETEWVTELFFSGELELISPDNDDPR